MFESIKVRVATLNIGLILFVAGILGFTSYFLMVETLEKTLTDNLSYIAGNKVDHLQSLITGKQDLLKQIALGDPVKRYSQSYQDKLLTEYFSTFKEEFPILSFVNQQGIEELKVINGINHFYLSDINQSRLFDEISWKPNTLFTTLNTLNNFTRVPFLELGYYRQNFFGSFEGIVIGRISLFRLLEHFREFKLGDNGFLMIIDELGNFLSHPNQNLITYSATADGIKSEELLNRATNMQTGIGRATIQGIDGYLAFAPMQERNWSVIAFLPYEEFIQTPVKFRNIFFIVLGIMLLLSISLSLYTAVSITSPISQLTQSSRRIAQGDLNQRVFIDTRNEIGHLAKSFNRMANSLQSSKEKLDSDTIFREQLIRELELKNNELERVTYTVSHDLKSPLVTVKGFIGMLREDLAEQDMEQVERDLEQISNASDKMGSLLEDLLEVSRVGRIQNEPELIPLTDLFEEVAVLLQGQIRTNEAELRIQENMPSVFADRHHLFGVAQNLIDNALKFSKPGCKPEISVTATKKQEQVICCVKDLGIGIDPKYHDKIFDLFDRLDQTVEGNGVGLALVKRIIEVHNGGLTVHSKGEGQGTTICFSLPVVHQETPI
jgi:signal transduction histidine kinase